MGFGLFICTARARRVIGADARRLLQEGRRGQQQVRWCRRKPNPDIAMSVVLRVLHESGRPRRRWSARTSAKCLRPPRFAMVAASRVRERGPVQPSVRIWSERPGCLSAARISPGPSTVAHPVSERRRPFRGTRGRPSPFRMTTSFRSGGWADDHAARDVELPAPSGPRPHDGGGADLVAAVRPRCDPGGPEFRTTASSLRPSTASGTGTALPVCRDESRYLSTALPSTAIGRAS